MIEITFENIKARTEALNLQLFNFGSCMRFNLHQIPPISNNIKQFALNKYNVNDSPLQGMIIQLGNISQIFNFQEAIFETLKMLRVK